MFTMFLVHFGVEAPKMIGNVLWLYCGWFDVASSVKGEVLIMANNGDCHCTTSRSPKDTVSRVLIYNRYTAVFGL